MESSCSSPGLFYFAPLEQSGIAVEANKLVLENGVERGFLG